MNWLTVVLVTPPTLLALAAFVVSLRNNSQITVLGQVIGEHITRCVEIVSRHRGDL